jgi:hypothetical protein
MPSSWHLGPVDRRGPILSSDGSVPRCRDRCRIGGLHQRGGPPATWAASSRIGVGARDGPLPQRTGGLAQRRSLASGHIRSRSVTPVTDRCPRQPGTQLRWLLDAGRPVGGLRHGARDAAPCEVGVDRDPPRSWARSARLWPADVSPANCDALRSPLGAAVSCAHDTPILVRWFSDAS